MVHSRSLLVGSVLLGAIVLVTTFAPILMPGDPTAVDLDRRLLPPGVAGLGTDHLGRDVAARLLYGARTTLGATAVLFSAVTLAGIAVGGIAGYRGGRVDTVLTGVTDIVLAFPGLVLAVAIAGTLGPGMHNLLLAVALVGWGNQARLVRALVLTERSKGYIEAARTMGATPLQVVRRHLVRNVANPLLALAAADLGRVITGLAGLSFLGLGAQPPTAEWGSMLNEARPFLQSHPHLLLFPALAICLTIAGCSLVGEGLRQVNDPRRH